jgi:hypothetical protein
MFLTFPFSKRVFILTSPPQEQKNLWVELEVRLFLLAWAMIPPCRLYGEYPLQATSKIQRINPACQPAGAFRQKQALEILKPAGFATGDSCPPGSSVPQFYSVNAFFP